MASPKKEKAPLPGADDSLCLRMFEQLRVGKLGLDMKIDRCCTTTPHMEHVSSLSAQTGISI